MAIPYDSTIPVPPAPVRLVRPRTGRWIGGVCAGIAAHIGVDVVIVRVVMVGLGLMGVGIFGYLFLWALTNEGEPGVAAPVPDARTARRSEALAYVLLGVLALVLGATALEHGGSLISTSFLFPIIIIGVGGVLAYGQLDDTQRGAWLGTGAREWRGVVRLVLGLLLVVGGMIALTSWGRSLTQFGGSLLSTLAVLFGVALIAAPYMMRVWSDLREEQAARARADERADIAAHLHDSVLQTLALIQRRSHDQAMVAQLARAQERELRSFLYGAQKNNHDSLSSAVADVCHEVEDVRGVPIEIVATGDRSLDADGLALVAALREALVNAVKHGEPPIRVYLEAGPSGVEAFVRDHGPGFDLEEVPEDRLGLRHSILQRMERHGGSARIRRLEAGTEVELRLPPRQAATVPAAPEPQPQEPQQPQQPQEPQQPRATQGES